MICKEIFREEILFLEQSLLLKHVEKNLSLEEVKNKYCCRTNGVHKTFFKSVLKIKNFIQLTTDRQTKQYVDDPYPDHKNLKLVFPILQLLDHDK